MAFWNKLFGQRREGAAPNPQNQVSRENHPNRQAPESPRAAERRQQEAERARVEAENVAIRERRQKATDAAREAVAKVQGILDGGELSEADRNYCQWTLKSAKDAYEQSLAQGQDKYKVKVMDAANQNVVMEREEGMPVEGLIYALEAAKARLERSRDNREQGELAYQRYRIKVPEGEEAAKPDNEKKEAWHEAYEKILPAEHFLRKEAEKLLQEWQRGDGRQYTGDELKWQLGEALRQVMVRENLIEVEADGKIQLKNAEGDTREQEQDLKKIVDVLKAESKKYFDYHQTRGTEQHPYTEREADLIGKDPKYRGILLKKYRDQRELPGNFGQLEKLGQDYELAKLAVRDRLVLDLPKEQPLPGSELPKTIYRINISELAKRMAQSLADVRLQKHYEEAKGVSGWFKRRGRALSEKWTRLELYDEALKEIMADQNLLKAMEARSMADQRLAGQKARAEGKKAKLSKDDIARNVEAAKTSAGHTASADDYFELIDSVIEEYDKEVITNSEKGENVQASDALNAEMAKLLVAHQRGGFADRAAFEAAVKNNPELQRLLKTETQDKQFSSEAEKQKQAGELLFAGNFYQIAEAYKKNVGKLMQEYTQRCVTEGREVNEQELMAHVRGALAFDLQLGLKDRDLANNKPDKFLEEYEKYKSGAGMFKMFNKGGAARILFNPFTYGMVAGGTSGAVGKAVIRGLSNKGVLVGATALGIGAFASFAVPIGVGAVFGGYYAAKKRREQAEADVRQAQRYEALGGQLSSVLDKQKTGLMKGEHELRYELSIGTAEAIADLERILALDALSDDDKKKLAGIAARLELKADKVADLFELDEESGKKFSSTQKIDSRMKILRADVERKFGLRGAADWDRAIQDQRLVLTDDAAKTEKNIKDFIKWEGNKARIVGMVAGAAGALVGQKLAYAGAEWAFDKMGFTSAADYFAHHGTTLDRAVEYFKGDHNTDLALFPLVEHAPGGSGRGGGALVEKFRYLHPGGAFESRIQVPPDLNPVKISSSGGIDRLELQDASGKSFGQFDLNTSNGRLSPVPGTLSPDIAHSSASIAGSGGGVRGSADWLSGIKGKLSGGNVETIHTKNWYSNPDLAELKSGNYVDTPNTDNELKFFVNRDAASGDLRLKVPVEEGGSWLVNGKGLDFAQITKAFGDGKIKMIFVPDGAAKTAGIVLEVDPTTQEVILPKGSELQKLWDPVTNKFKGTGFFGLAEETGVRPDGSKDYIWINSERGDKSNIDFGSKENFKDIMHTITLKNNGEGKGYDMAFPTHGWRRKNYDRYRAPAEQVAQAEDQHQAQAGTGQAAGTRTGREQEPRAQLTQEQARDITNRFIAAARDVNQSDDQVFELAKEFRQAGQQHEVSEELLNQMIADLSAVEEPAKTRIQNAISRVESEELARRQQEEAQAAEQEDLDGGDDETPVAAAAATAQASQARPAAGAGRAQQPRDNQAQVRPGTNETPRATAQPARVAGAPVRSEVSGSTSRDSARGENLGPLMQELIDGTGHRIHFSDIAGEANERQKSKVLSEFKSALGSLPDEVRERALNKVNGSRQDLLLKHGLILAFPSNNGNCRFDNQDRLLLPPNVSADNIKEFLLEKFGGRPQTGAQRDNRGGRRDSNRSPQRNNRTRT